MSFVIDRPVYSMDKRFEDLLNEHRSMMLSYASTLLSGDRHEAEDVVQEACVTAFSKRDEFEVGRSFPKWIRGVIRFKAMESRRQSQRRAVPQDPEVIQGIDNMYALFDQHTTGTSWQGRLELLKFCVSKLDDPMRFVVERFYRSGLSVNEISMQMGLKLATVTKRLSRSRKRIRACVASRIQLEDL